MIVWWGFHEMFLAKRCRLEGLSIVFKFYVSVGD